MAEENQVMTKDPKKVEAGKRLAEYNHRKREELTVQKSEVLTLSQCYSIGAVLAVGGDRRSWLLCLPSQGQCRCNFSTSATP